MVDVSKSNLLRDGDCRTVRPVQLGLGHEHDHQPDVAYRGIHQGIGGTYPWWVPTID